MPGFDGNGVFVRSYNWTSDAANKLDITASRFDVEHNSFAAALSSVVTRDGQGKPQTHWLPKVTASYDLGSGAMRWKDLYLSGTINLSTAGKQSFFSAQTPNQRTAAEITASVIPTDYSYLPGDIRRYGADPTGALDSTLAINNALASNTRVYAIAGTYVCSASLNLISGQTFCGDGAATVLQFANASLNNIVGTGITNTVVQDLKINITGSGAASTFAAVLFQTNCVACKAERVEVVGAQWSGVWIKASSYCEVRNCYFHGFTGSQNGTADVIVTDDGTSNLADYNIVADNECFAGGWYGVAFMQYYGAGAVVPRYCLAHGNRIGQHVAYGALFYNVTTNADSWHSAIGNYIENIQGTVLTGNSGAGIYCAGAGGCTFTGNVIRNVCVSTSADTLAPAGIGINGAAGLSPFVISGNFILNPQNFYGIKLTGCPTGGTITGNTISLQAGTPVAAIYFLTSSNVTVSGNTINVATSLATTHGIFATASTANISNISISGNTITGCSFRGIRIDQSGGFNVSNFSVNGNTVTGGSAACIPISLAAAVNGTITGNTALATTTFALSINASTGVRYAGNFFSSTGTVVITTTGACTGSYFDKSNTWNADSGHMVNGATGLIVEWLAGVVPGSGTWAVGDRTEMSVPVVASPKGWRCTVAGAPGTWVSEGNL
jgi:hypothetical protein